MVRSLAALNTVETGQQERKGLRAQWEHGDSKLGSTAMTPRRQALGPGWGMGGSVLPRTCKAQACGLWSGAQGVASDPGGREGGAPCLGTEPRKWGGWPPSIWGAPPPILSPQPVASCLHRAWITATTRKGCVHRDTPHDGGGSHTMVTL